MSLICFASQKGSPGTTLTALSVAAFWPADGRRKVLLEADPDGGCLALRYRLGRQPGLVTLAAAIRHGLAAQDLWVHTQVLPGGLPVIVAPERPDRVTGVLAMGASSLAPWLASLPGVDVIVDCGRLHPGSPAMPLALQADAVYFVMRPVAEQIYSTAERATALQQQVPRVAWVQIGDQPYDVAAVAEATGIPVAAVLPDDHRVAAALTAGESPSRLRRSLLVRSLARLAATEAQRVLERTTEKPAAAKRVQPSEAPRIGALA